MKLPAYRSDPPLRIRLVGIPIDLVFVLGKEIPLLPVYLPRIVRETFDAANFDFGIRSVFLSLSLTDFLQFPTK